MQPATGTAQQSMRWNSCCALLSAVHTLIDQLQAHRAWPKHKTISAGDISKHNKCTAVTHQLRWQLLRNHLQPLLRPPWPLAHSRQHRALLQRHRLIACLHNTKLLCNGVGGVDGAAVAATRAQPGLQQPRTAAVTALVSAKMHSNLL
jgi:hypothetical protein